MTDQATRRTLIQSAVVLAGGTVPSLRQMRDILALDGITVSSSTLHADYAALGYRRSAPATVVHTVKIPVDVYDTCCRMALRKGTSVSAVIRALIAAGLKHRRAAA